MTPRTTRPWLGLLGGALCCSVWSASANSLTTDQLFESQCEQLEQELSANYDRQRQGFRLSQEQAIEKAAASLQQLLDDACQSPRVDPEPQDPQQQFQQVTRQNQRSLAPSTRAKVKTQTHRERATRTIKTARSKPRREPTSTTAVRTVFPGLQVSSVSLSAPYSGAKLMAWLGFYREPPHCFNVRDLSRIVQCAEARQQARQRFEHLWHQQRPSKPSGSGNLSDQ